MQPNSRLCLKLGCSKGIKKILIVEISHRAYFRFIWPTSFHSKPFQPKLDIRDGSNSTKRQSHPHPAKALFLLNQWCNVDILQDLERLKPCDLSAPRPIQFTSCNVRLSVYLSICPLSVNFLLERDRTFLSPRFFLILFKKEMTKSKTKWFSAKFKWFIYSIHHRTGGYFSIWAQCINKIYYININKNNNTINCPECVWYIYIILILPV